MYVISGSGDRREVSRDTTADAAVWAGLPAFGSVANARFSEVQTSAHRRARVTVVLNDQPAIGEALNQTSSRALHTNAASSNRADIASWERRRESTLRRISSASAAAVRDSQRPVIRRLKALGARVESHSSAPNSIVAVIPNKSLDEAREIAGVATVETTPRRSLLAASDAEGSPTWHAAGCTGAGVADSSCTGAADSSDGKGGPDVAFIDQGINLFHSAWGTRNPRIVTAPKRSLVYGNTNFCAPKNPVFNYWCGYGSQHGNAVASIVGSRDASHLGMAHGIDKLIDPLGAGSTDDWLLGFTNASEAPTSDLPEVVNDSSGAASGNSDPYAEKVADLYTATFGIARTGAAGNTPGQRVQSPCIAHNTLCAGGLNPNGAGRADDAVATYTSPGPTLSGRKKPDLLAPGAADCPSAVNNHAWIENCGEGTSYASARLAGASALLAGAGITDVNSQRALLINTALMTPSAHDAVLSGAARYWTPDGAWGALDLDAAHAQREKVVTGSVPAAPGATEDGGPNSARFYRVNSLATGDRMTLAWNRRINAPVWPQITSFSAHTSTDLNLQLFKTTGETYNGVDNDDNTACVIPKAGGGTPTPVAHCGVDAEEHNENTGPVAVAADARDNVEQVRAANSGAAIVKVDAASGIDGAAAEPFALSSTRPLTPLDPPEFEIPAPSVSAATGHVGDTFTITSDATNASSGTDLVDALSLFSVSSWIDVPEGLAVTGTTMPASSLLAPGATRQIQYTVQAEQSGAYDLRAGATGLRFGESFESASTETRIVIDDDDPAVQLDSPASWFAARTAVVDWSATDQLSSVADVEIQTSIDGASFSTAYQGGDDTGSLHVSAEEGQSVRVRARATDAAGNQSDFTELHSWTVDAEEPQIDLQVPAKVAYGARAQVIVRAFNVGAPVTAYARYHPSQPFTPVDEGLLIIPAVARQGKPVTVEAQALDALNRIVRRSATINTVANKVGLSMKVVRKGKRKLLRVNMTRTSTGTLVVSARCGRKRLGNRIDVERSAKALVALRGATGTCSVTANLRPAATYQAASAKTSKRLRF